MRYYQGSDNPIRTAVDMRLGLQTAKLPDATQRQRWHRTKCMANNLSNRDRLK